MARTLKPCGTIAAYMRHRRAGEEPCRACRDAQAIHQRARRAAKARGKELILWRPLVDAQGSTSGSGSGDAAPGAAGSESGAPGGASAAGWAAFLSGHEDDVQLADAFENYAIVRGAMNTTSLVAPLAGLSRRRQELVEYMVNRRDTIIAAAAKTTRDAGGGDEFSKRRAERAARRADRRAATAN